MNTFAGRAALLAMALPALFLAAAAIATPPAVAARLAPPAVTGLHPAPLSPALVSFDHVTSATVAVVYYKGGRFMRVGPRRWVEMGDNGARFNFEELGPDESAMYLIDRSRNVQIALDLSRRVILYSHNKEPFRPLYQMTGAEAAGGAPAQPTTSQTVTFTCNEGIPLVVRFVNSPSQSLAFASYDSSPEIRMENAPSGSGARYVNGTNELHTKGNTAIFTFDGNQDICTRN